MKKLVCCWKMERDGAPQKWKWLQEVGLLLIEDEEGPLSGAESELLPAGLVVAEA